MTKKIWLQFVNFSYIFLYAYTAEFFKNKRHVTMEGEYHIFIALCNILLISSCY